MKDLHNHIFSNTTCISKETMLKYMNQQLSKEELHQVETHMLDCELCTDAYEGLAFAENSSMLFAIDSQIDQRVKGSVSRVPFMRNLMLAASVLVIAFGTYFTFSFFNNTINKENNIALNEAVKSTQQNQLEAMMSHSTGDVDLDAIELKNKRSEAAEQVIPAPVVVLAEERNIAAQDDAISEAEFEVSDLSVAEDFAAESFSSDEMEDVELAEESMEDERMDVVEETVAANKFDMNKDNSTEKKEEVMLKLTTQASSKKSAKNLRTSFVASTPIQADAMGKELTEDPNATAQELIVIEGYKVVNYLDEYQKTYDANRDALPEGHSVSAGFESKADKNISENARAKITVEVTYKETLENAIRLYKNQKYKKALSAFDVILVKHPKEVNGLFYSGLCYYNMGQHKAAMRMFNAVLKNEKTEFNEETNWYKALALINIQSITSAKKLLNNIVEKDGFYKEKAEAKLKGL